MDTLFTDNIKVVYNHPWSKSLNDNSLNKTLCYSYFAEKLDEKSPHDFFSDDPEQWEKVVDRAADLFSIVSIIPPTRKNSESLSKDTTEEITSRINWMIPILYAGKSHVF